MRKFILAIGMVFLLLAAFGERPMAAPFLSCAYYEALAAPDSFLYLVDGVTPWLTCNADVAGDGRVRMRCDLATLPLGGHMLRAQAVKTEAKSPGDAWVYIYKTPWKDFHVYYILMSDPDGKIHWDFQTAVTVK